LTLALGASAQASIPIGQLSPVSTAGGCTTKFDLLQFAVNRGTDYVVPETGTITSWSTRAGTTPGQMLTFKVFRPGSSGGYTVVAHDGPRALTPGVINTFHVGIKVKLSDVIGLSTTSATPGAPIDCVFNPEESESDAVFGFDGDAPDGALLGPHADNRKVRANVTATVLQPPDINIFGHVQLGSVAGGGRVVLEGNHFEEVSGVTFGGVAAKSFTVTDEHHVTAIAPPGRTLQGTSAAVSTPAGTATSTPFFFYSGCQVPKLTGKTLKAAKGRLKSSGCKLGRVAKVRGRHGKVVKQSPKPGKLLPPGAKVSIKVGR
jgi:hypothetical protein